MEGPFFMGHRRLSIIDLSPQGRQPMATPDGQLIVVFNGEIYNFIELREELIAAGHRFRTRSDTEVLLHGYREWGTDLPKRLVGMFAFGIADRSRNELFLVRDRFGEKPLLYMDHPGSVTFASEMRPLSALLGAGRELNRDALPSYLCLNYVPGDQTLMNGVRRLPPGTWRLYGSSGDITTGVYWSPRYLEASVRMEEASERLESLLDQAVKLTLRSDVPVGVFLSGGIDSSLISRSAARSGRLSAAYCLSFEEETYSEWDKAKETALQLGIPITRIVVSSKALADFVELVEHADDPLADSSCVAVWTLAREASKSSKVVLSGDGGDELFGGYLTYRATMLHDALTARLPMPLRHLVARLAPAIPTSETKVSATYKLMRFLRAADLPASQAHFTWNGVWLPEAAAGFLDPVDLKSHARTSMSRLATTHALPVHPSLWDLQRADLSEYLPNDILVKVDRMSMAHGLEVRAPFLNHSVAEFALSLPGRLKTSLFGGTKKILRETARHTYGVRASKAKKQGFSIPIHAWVRGPGRELVQDLLGERSVRDLDMIDPVRVNRALADHMSGRCSLGFEIWGLMVLVAWYRARVQPRPALTNGSEELVERFQFPPRG